MEAIRHFITPKTRNLEIVIPESLVDEKLEVIILPASDTVGSGVSAYKSLKGSVSKEEAAKMLRSLEESRNDWG